MNDGGRESWKRLEKARMRSDVRGLGESERERQGLSFPLTNNCYERADTPTKIIDY